MIGGTHSVLHVHTLTINRALKWLGENQQRLVLRVIFHEINVGLRNMVNYLPAAIRVMNSSRLSLSFMLVACEQVQLYQYNTL